MFLLKKLMRLQSNDSIEKYAYGAIKDLVSEKEEIKCSNIVKRYKIWLTLMMLEKKKQKNIILFIHNEY